jgi:hypothetical protein
MVSIMSESLPGRIYSIEECRLKLVLIDLNYDHYAVECCLFLHGHHELGGELFGPSCMPHIEYAKEVIKIYGDIVSGIIDSPEGHKLMLEELSRNRFDSRFEDYRGKYNFLDVINNNLPFYGKEDKRIAMRDLFKEILLEGRKPYLTF